MGEELMIAVYILAGVLGLCIGSFLNVVIYRLPLGMSLSKPASHCTKCDYVLRWYDNIPVLSYIMLGGKCRKCKQKISPRYMLVELFSALTYLLSVYMFWDISIVYAVLSALTSSVLICVFFIDLSHMIILDRFQIILLLFGVVAIFFDGYTAWYDHLIGFGAGGVLFLLIYYGAILLLKKEGLGFGDVKLAFVCGLLLGWQKFLLAMLIASISACICLIPARFKRGGEGKEFPFAPFITVGVFIALFFGEIIINWYLGILGL
ncbi:MAG: prepilin peptidase [Clostridiales bacterium]|nr:prepilin peptidase [Clostridiales bacterium]